MTNAFRGKSWVLGSVTLGLVAAGCGSDDKTVSGPQPIEIQFDGGLDAGQRILEHVRFTVEDPIELTDNGVDFDRSHVYIADHDRDDALVVFGCLTDLYIAYFGCDRVWAYEKDKGI